VASLKQIVVKLFVGLEWLSISVCVCVCVCCVYVLCVCCVWEKEGRAYNTRWQRVTFRNHNQLLT